VIDANVFPVLIDILGKGEFKTRKEAAWAITNTSSGGQSQTSRTRWAKWQIYILSLKIYHPIPWWVPISRPITLHSKTAPLDHAARTTYVLEFFSSTFYRACVNF
jgi:hypothetical protein